MSEETKPVKKLSLRRKLLFALITVVGFFVLAEALLFIGGIQVVQDVERMEFTFPIDDFNNSSPEPFLRRDGVVFWTPRANVAGHNSMGFFGPEFQEKKAPDVFRIVCIGDSCTHFGPITYTEILQKLLDENQSRKIEVINAGVIGYTSYQGKMLMKTRVANWEPDLVTCYFGWNDHWLARGLMDCEQTEQPKAATFANRFRTVQFLRLMTSGLRSNSQAQRMRVELPDYESNLTEIAETCKTIGSKLWFITAPQAMDISIPDYLYTSGEVTDPSKLVEIHGSYNDMVRTVAAKTGAELVDLDKTFDGLSKNELFIDDHVHLSLEGKQVAVQQLYERLRSTGVIGTQNKPSE